MADNVKVPGAPEYRVYLREHGPGRGTPREHPAHVEHQSVIRDLVLESEYTGA